MTQRQWSAAVMSVTTQRWIGGLASSSSMVLPCYWSIGNHSALRERSLAPVDRTGPRTGLFAPGSLLRAERPVVATRRRTSMLRQLSARSSSAVVRGAHARITMSPRLVVKRLERIRAPPTGGQQCRRCRGVRPGHGRIPYTDLAAVRTFGGLVMVGADIHSGSRALDNGRSRPIATALAADSRRAALEVSGWGIRPPADCSYRARTRAVHPTVDDVAARDYPRDIWLPVRCVLCASVRPTVFDGIVAGVVSGRRRDARRTVGLYHAVRTPGPAKAGVDG